VFVGNDGALPLSFLVNNTERMRINNDGNVGIGTTSPSTFAGGGLTLGTNTIGKNIILNSSADGNNGLLQFIDLNSNNSLQIGGGTTQNSLYGYGNRPMVFFTNDTERMRITAGGNVGIGTTNPLLHSGTTGLVVRGYARGIIELWDATAGKAVFQQVGGDTYIGSLDKGTGTGDLIFLVNGSGTSADNGAIIKANGFLGVGTTTPSERLHVSGRARITTIDNGTGDFVTVSGTGVLTKRTATQTISDINGISNATDTFSSTDKVVNIVTLTEAEYATLSPKDGATLYVVI
jgi:hypothetical protein